VNLSYYLLIGILAILATGGIAYYLIAVYCAYRLRDRRVPGHQGTAHELPPMSLLKPLHGAEPELERCLESFFVQDYPGYEILFAVRHDNDPAVDVVNQLSARYPHIPTKMILTGEPPYANAKVYSMEKMAEAARHRILVITDSDASVASDYLQSMAREFASPQVGAVTNLYRGVSGRDLWSKMEALGMTTEFMAGVVVAERLEGMKFTLGPSMAIRSECLDAIGGFSAMKDYLADDFVLGNWADRAGWRVALSMHIINHHASNEGFSRTFIHRLRWNRSSRFSRPAGYMGQGFTYGLVWGLLLFPLAPAWWSLGLLLSALILRFWLAIRLGVYLLDDHSVWRKLWLLPMQDSFSFASWVGGFLGREIAWRSERYRLLSGGRFKKIPKTNYS
jgi:ceramide glucosyltransferase